MPHVATRFGLILCTLGSFVLLFAGSAAAAYVYQTYYYEAYSPGEQHGSSYDCPYGSHPYAENDFSKDATKLGKSIFINTNGSWIAQAEDTQSITILFRPDLERTTKKGSVKNTSTSTYTGFGAVFWWDNHWCV